MKPPLAAATSARITAALDGAEKNARAATPGPWWPESGGDFGSRFWIIGNVLRERYGNNALNFGEDEGTARYVAFWSPDRVLALIAADRRVLDRHGKPNDHLTSRFEHSYYGCPRCSGAWPCPDLLDLAARWGVTP